MSLAEEDFFFQNLAFEGSRGRLGMLTDIIDAPVVRSCNNKKAMIQNYILLTLLNQALFFTGFWTTPTNGFGGFLSLEKNP